MIQPFGNIIFYDSQAKVPENFRMYPVLCESRTKLPPFQIITTYEGRVVSKFEWLRYNETNITLDQSGLSAETPTTKTERVAFHIYNGTTIGVTLPFGYGQIYLKDNEDNEFYSQFILIK